jgi:hypothetical protein
MENKTPETPHINIALKAKYAFYSTLIFFLIASPETYKLTQQILGHMFTILNDSGSPSPMGFFFHTFLFLLFYGVLCSFHKTKYRIYFFLVNAWII